MPDFVVKANDTEPLVANLLYNTDGSLVDLTNATVELALFPITIGAAQPLLRSAVVGSPPTAGEVSYQLTQADTGNPGLWFGGWIVSFAGGGRQTYPTDQYLSVLVEPDPSAALPTTPNTRGTDPGWAIYRLQNMLAWTTDPCLTGVDVVSLLAAARRQDVAGLWVTDSGWLPTFDLTWAAMEGWAWKAGVAAARYDIKDGTASLSRSGVYKNCKAMADMYNMRWRSTPQAIRAQGATIVDRQVGNNLLPWWYSSLPIN